MPDTPLTTYYLEMHTPNALRPKTAAPGLTTEHVTPPDPALNHRLYRQVGADWNWNERLPWSLDDWRAYLARPGCETWLGRLDGQTFGYYELLPEDHGDTELAYFGLLPEFTGRGLGGALLTAAVQRAWALPTTRRMWLHTCTEDHPHAIANYQSRGFKLYKTEQT